MRMNGMTIEDDETQRGTKISWVLSSDLNGCLPNSMLNFFYTKYQTAFIKSLIQACNQIVKGQLK
jgi:hypothetical protein